MKTYLKIFVKAYEWFKNLINNTEGYVVISASIVITLTITMLIFLQKEIKHSKLIPLGFSEIEQIEYDLNRKGKTIDPMTEYYAKLNDVLNKVFECWNTSLNFAILGNSNEAFARELQHRKDMKIYKYEFDLFDSLPKISDKAIEKLKKHKFIDLVPTLHNVEMQFSKVWSEDHDDEYRTEIYTTTSTDSDGNSHTETRTREVYDHTDHTYTYYKKQGEFAYQTGMKMVKYFYNISWPGTLLRPSKTNAEGEYAADKSRRKILDRQGEADLLEIATKWNEGSLYTDVKENILAYNGMYTLLKTWEKHKDTARNVSYKTNSHSDAGPIEYQTVDYIKTLTNGVTTNINILYRSIINTKNELPKLKKKIDSFINIVLDNKKGNVNSLRHEIISIAKQIYKCNFPNGLNLSTFRIDLLFLWISVAYIVGFCIGYGLKKLFNKNNKEHHEFYRW